MAWIDEMLSGIPVNPVLRERLLLEQEQRIALANQHTALSQRFSVSESNVIKLEAENKELRLCVIELRQEIQRRDNVIKEKESHGNHLEKVKEEMLQLLADHPDATEQQLAKTMDMGIQLVMFHLTELEKSRLVHGSYNALEPTEWSLDHEGRRYLVAHGLIT